ncbi:Arm DNA-binding domain-containing protein [Falsiruegeria litorea]|uniref:Arm DNA-binding domain-containing protein n=1 Tax=Falsiruegeria litorea TaxID=1280831 RepID=UPI001F259E91|nr:Arm DNA-binding domain-containing protein [Falsiruegeria litorea]
MHLATSKRYEVRDQKISGLHVRVSTTGAKVFYTMVRPNGSCRRVKIGPYPVVSLADARRKAMGIARDVELGEFDNAACMRDDTKSPPCTLAMSASSCPFARLTIRICLLSMI